MRKIILRAQSGVLLTKVFSHLLVGICHGAALQVELQSVLEKAEDLLRDMHLLENIVRLLQNAHLIDLIITEEEIFKGIMKGDF